MISGQNLLSKGFQSQITSQIHSLESWKWNMAHFKDDQLSSKNIEKHSARVLRSSAPNLVLACPGAQRRQRPKRVTQPHRSRTVLQTSGTSTRDLINYCMWAS